MFIKKEIRDQVGILTIDRPDALNAMNAGILRELDQSVKNMIASEDVGVIILTGAGEKAFIAGADIKLMQQLDNDKALDFGKLGQEVTMTIEDSPKPVIAAINGFALGGGCEIALACHIRFASENAMFAQPEVKLGLIPRMGRHTAPAPDRWEGSCHRTDHRWSYDQCRRSLTNWAGE